MRMIYRSSEDVGQLLALYLSLLCERVSPASRPILLLLTSREEMTTSLKVLQHSRFFHQIILLYSGMPSQLSLAVDQPMNWETFLDLFLFRPVYAAPPIQKSILEEEKKQIHHKDNKDRTYAAVLASATMAPSQTLFQKQFEAVMAIYKTEKLLPKESLIRSTLEQEFDYPSNQMDTWVKEAVNQGLAIVTGAKPQRVIWPTSPASRFQCIDYMAPTDRLCLSQMNEVMEFLTTSPEAIAGTKGRFGMARLMKQAGPQFIRQLPLGFVLELTQLLLNRGFLLYHQRVVSLLYVSIFPFLSDLMMNKYVHEMMIGLNPMNDG